jgi:hypothetical protein
MLYAMPDAQAALDMLGPFQPRDYPLRNYVQRAGTRCFADSLAQPQALLATRGADVMVHAPQETSRLALMRDLFEHNFDQQAWPDEKARQDWQREQGPYVFLNSTPIPVRDAGVEAGFVVPEGFSERAPANLYWFEGPPRFGRLIKHSCRLGRGLELLELLQQGVGYDEDGYYTRLVLQENQSFVVEVGGRPVSWSTVHLNGTMGMIYTPPEHRRQGYARSLAAFQIDHQLRRHSFACCHVNGDNEPSYTMLLSMGARRDEVPVGWRLLLWPA